jgi:hypothetical protein
VRARNIYFSRNTTQWSNNISARHVPPFIVISAFLVYYSLPPTNLRASAAVQKPRVADVDPFRFDWSLNLALAKRVQVLGSDIVVWREV